MLGMAGVWSLLSSEYSDDLAGDDELRVDSKFHHRQDCTGDVASPGVDLNQSRIEKLPLHSGSVWCDELDGMLLITETAVMAVSERELNERVERLSVFTVEQKTSSPDVTFGDASLAVALGVVVVLLVKRERLLDLKQACFRVSVARHEQAIIAHDPGKPEQLMVGKSPHGVYVVLLGFIEAPDSLVEEGELMETFASPGLIHAVTAEKQKPAQRRFIAAQGLQVVELLLKNLEQRSEL